MVLASWVLRSLAARERHARAAMLVERITCYRRRSYV
jgi:hypothetical protein